MKVLHAVLLAWLLTGAQALAQAGGVDYRLRLWEYPLPAFDDAAYAEAVEVLFRRFEAARGSPVEPGEHGRAGLKLYTHSGIGLATPKPLVRAAAAALERRGFAREDIILVDEAEFRLRQSDYLPSLSEGGSEFEGMPVLALDSGRYYNEKWFYDSPLASREERPRPVIQELEGLDIPGLDQRQERRSYLPVPLLLEVDFWINLPVFTDSRALGVSGALANATVWNISNASRFLTSGASGPIAVAEIAAIPELQETWLFTIASLESYQFIGGPVFNANYTGSENALWLSANPVLMDYLMYVRFNLHRERRGLPLIEPEPAMLQFSRTLGLGDERLSATRRIRLSPDGSPESSGKDEMPLANAP